MNDEPDKRESKHARRQDRLKLALRENLKRRKSQARSRGERLDAVGGDDDKPRTAQDGKE